MIFSPVPRARLSLGAYGPSGQPGPQPALVQSHDTGEKIEWVAFLHNARLAYTTNLSYAQHMLICHDTLA